MIISGLKFGFAQGERVVIPSLPSEPMICLQDLFEKFQVVDEVTGGGIQCLSAFRLQRKGFTFFTFYFLIGETRSYTAQ